MKNEEKKYFVACYMKVPVHDIELMTHDEAMRELEHYEFLQPENIYRIETLGEDEESVV